MPKQWVFSQHAGINFNTDPPTSFVSSINDTAEGTACITDSFGNILFYTDGGTVYTRDNNIMENGEGLYGYNGSTQSALILKAPGSNPFYYIFTTEGFEYNLALPIPKYGLCYSVVDISANGYKGKVIKKNVGVMKATGENLTAIKHSNKKDFWIISHGYNNDSLVSFLVTDAGVNIQPVVTLTGFYTNEKTMFVRNNNTGFLKANRAGNLIAKVYTDITNTGVYKHHAVILYQFNNISGNAKYFMSIPIDGHDIVYPYGLEFSLSGRFLYIGNLALINPGILQYDLSSNDTNEILKSKYFISTSAPDNQHVLGGMAMGPDGKLYFVQTHSCEHYLACIPYPDLKAPKCGFIKDAIKLHPGTESGFGFINISEAMYDKPAILIKGKCVPGEFTFSTNVYEQDSINWFIKDSFIVHSISNNVKTMIKSSGKIIIRAIVYYEIGSDTLSSIYNFQSPPQISLPNDTILCSGDIILISAITDASRVIWSTRDSTKSINISFPGKFFATAIDTIGCSAIDSITISQPQKPYLQLTIKPFCVDSPAIVSVEPSNILLNYKLFWSNGDKDNLSTKYFSERDEYLTLTDSNNCIFIDTFSIKELCAPTLFVPNTFTPNGDGLNDIFLPLGSFLNKYSLQIYNRWGEKIYESNNLYLGWDGNFMGKPAPSGIYAYIINAKGETGKDISLKGSVMLIR